MNQKKLAEQVAEAQRTLHDQIAAALQRFTETTGLIVPAASWNVATALNADGNVASVEYWSIKSDLSTGLT